MPCIQKGLVRTSRPHLEAKSKKKERGSRVETTNVFSGGDYGREEGNGGVSQSEKSKGECGHQTMYVVKNRNVRELET
jgi:hypothetical protein